MLHDGLTDAMYGIHMGCTADNIAKKYNISKQELPDAYRNMPYLVSHASYNRNKEVFLICSSYDFRSTEYAIYFRSTPVSAPYMFDSIGNHWLEEATCRPEGYPHYHYLQTEKWMRRD